VIEVATCPNRFGMWLDFNEVDKLEEVVFNNNAHKKAPADYLRELLN